MATVKKSYFPSEGIMHKGLKYVSALESQETAHKSEAELKIKGYKVLTVEVFSKNLKGKTDLHGQPYQPSKFLFISK